MSCPICENDSVEAFKPFCSKRCADIDLGRWFSGQYRVASTREDDPAELSQAIEEDADKLH